MFVAAILLHIVAWCDAIVAVCGESLKTYVREVWRFGSQLVSFVALLLLRLVHRPAYNYQVERRNRIRCADSLSSAEAQAALTDRTPRFVLVDAPPLPPPGAQRVAPLRETLLNADDIVSAPVVSPASWSRPRQRNLFDAVVQREHSDDEVVNSNVHHEADDETVRSVNSDSIDGEDDDEEDVVDDDNDELVRGSPPSSIRRDASDVREAATTTLTVVRGPARTIRQEAVHAHEQAITGLLEDILISILLAIERATSGVRHVLAFFADVLRGYDASERRRRQAAGAAQRASGRKSLAVVRQRRAGDPLQRQVATAPIEYLSMRSSLQDMRTLVAHAGYPYSRHKVVTSDGYVLLLERIGRRDSKRAILMQHGIFDSSYSWLAAGAQRSLAFRAFDSGFDVFLGNLRGTQFSRGHVNATISVAEYWDFCVDDHAAHDLPAFIDTIHRLKRAELAGAAATSSGADSGESAVSPPEEPKVELSVVAHSMGAACVLAHLVQAGLRGRSAGITRAVLLAPAGYHATAPFFCRLTGPLISLAVRWLPIHSFRLAWPLVRRLTTKLMADVRGSSAAGSLFVVALTRLLGGQLRPANEHHPFGALPDLARVMTESATSARVFNQFWQMWKHRRFEAYDYGAAANRARYGTPQPLDYMANYHVIDCPVYFLLGLDDKLIQPVSVIGQYRALVRSHPDAPSRTFIKALPDAGHIELTLAPDERAISWVLSVLRGEDS
jgi:hypothetical protein